MLNAKFVDAQNYFIQCTKNITESFVLHYFCLCWMRNVGYICCEQSPTNPVSLFIALFCCRQQRSHHKVIRAIGKI